MIRRQSAFDGGGSVIAITSGGRRAVGLDGRLAALARSTSSGGLAHGRAVSWVAARQTIAGRQWLSERDLRAGRGWPVRILGDPDDRRVHHPDLAVLIEAPGGGAQHRVAVEVELTRKSPGRLEPVLAGYRHALDMGTIDRLVYISDQPDTLRHVQHAADRLGIDAIQTFTLARIQHDTRAAARQP